MESKDLAFFGKVAAGFTHELKNVLAIINESNGLMADLLGMAKDNPFPLQEKFLRSVGKIRDQVDRGVALTNRFNGFAHSMDHESADVDLNELVTRTVALTERFARLKFLELKGRISDCPTVVRTNSFRLQMLLTRAVEALMEIGLSKGCILVAVSEERGKSAIDFGCEAESGVGESGLREALTAAPAWREVVDGASALNLEILWERAADARFSFCWR